jgi:indole-3-glycerol phosphate synthase
MLEMILDKIVANRRLQVEREKAQLSLKHIINSIENIEIRDFAATINTDSIAIIAEIKKASPSKGIIKDNFDHEAIASVYEEINIDAISVLTERDFFLGKDEYLKDVKAVARKPLLRKDFIVDEYQLYQSKALGADAVLLIAGVLQKELGSYYKLAQQLGLCSIVEVHDREELDLALEADCGIIGINNRNLKTFEVNLHNTEKLMKYVPGNKLIVSESGIEAPEDIKYLRSLGVKAVLIGETFMRNIDDIDTLKKFVKEAKAL